MIEEKTYEKKAQRKKRIIQLFWLCEVSFLLAALHPILTLNWLHLFLMFVFSALLYFAYLRAQSDQLDQAANIIIIVISSVILTFSWLNDGVRDEILLVFPALVTFSVLIGSQRALYIMLAVILGNVLLMGFLNDKEIYINSLTNSGLESALLISFIFCIVFYSIKILGNDLMKVNDQLRQQQEILESEVKDRTSSLEYTIEQFIKAKRDLVEADKMASLGRLVAGIAHEINTPVGVAVTAASLIKDKNDKIRLSFEENTLARNQLLEYLNTTEQTMVLLNANLSRASNLITDFKEVAVFKEDERRKTFNISTEINNIFTYLQPETERKFYQVNINCPTDINIYQDPEVLTRILVNLYTNSIKHGFEGKASGVINVTVSLADNIITLSYQDNGIGITNSAIDKIFEPFYTTKRGQGGTGLGMHIVYNLVTQSLGGQIHYDSSFKNGSKFDITFNNLF